MCHKYQSGFSELEQLQWGSSEPCGKPAPAPPGAHGSVLVAESSSSIPTDLHHCLGTQTPWKTTDRLHCQLAALILHPRAGVKSQRPEIHLENTAGEGKRLQLPRHAIPSTADALQNPVVECLVGTGGKGCCLQAQSLLQNPPVLFIERTLTTAPSWEQRGKLLMRHTSRHHGVTATSTSDVPKSHAPSGSLASPHQGGRDPSALAQGNDPSLMVFSPSFPVFSKPDAVAKQTQSKS